MPIRRRLVLYAIAVSAAGMLLFTFLISSLGSGGAAEERDAALATSAIVLAEVVESVGPSALADRAPLVLVDAAVSDDVIQLVTDESGDVLYSTATLGGSPIQLPAAIVVEAFDQGQSTATIGRNGAVVRVVANRWSTGGRTGVAVAGQSERALERQLEGLNTILLLAALVTVIAVAAVTWLVVGRALRPLRDLSRTADQISNTGDLGHRLPEAGSRDEVGALTSSFNGMLDRLAAVRSELAASLAAQQQLAADASHELRTPLTTIRTNAEMLREHPDMPRTQRDEIVADIADESARMTGLVEDLLLLARADAGRLAERRPVDLAALTQDVARKARTPDRPVISRADGAAVVEGDPEALGRLAWILVDNAVRHGAGTVRVDTAMAADWVELTVSDEGPGFPDESSELVFERFYRGDPMRSGAGAGLGLAIARAIVDAHGGSIRAEMGRGGVIRVRLPAAIHA